MTRDSGAEILTRHAAGQMTFGTINTLLCMRLLIISENHFLRDQTGHIYGGGTVSYTAWSGCLEAFDKVTVLARVSVGDFQVGEGVRSDGPSVAFLALPDYLGPWEYLRKLKILRASIRRAVAQSDAYILRVPGLVGRLAWQEIRRVKKPYALEVVGDPWDALAPGTWPSLFRPIFRRAGTRELKAMCREASAVHYVTESALQQRYPAAPEAYTTTFPNALMDSAYATVPILEERFRRIGPSKPLRIGFIGSLAQMYKGPDVLLCASSLCRAAGRNFELLMVGDGRYAEKMKQLAKRLKVENRTQFVPRLPPGKSVFDFLDSVDLFVMPSRAEGLPRAMLEAMARGCPCIGSNIGGIPELLAADDLVPANDPQALAQTIMEVTSNPDRMKAMSERNFARAKQFDPETLRVARRAFYQYVRDHSANNGKSGREAR
jgi:glycosyltransferase involved in cell wall biosynthesis